MHQLEAWTALAALAPLTERIEIIAAIKPSLYHPVVLAKMAQQIEHISGGRIAINLVNAWNRRARKRGHWISRAQRTIRLWREWITVIESLLRGEHARFDGKHFHIDDYCCARPIHSVCGPVSVGG